jgi:HEAT repeat protein
VVRAAAAQALGQIGPAAGEARPALVRALSDPDAQVGALAAKALKLLPAPAAEDIGDLRRALREQNPKVRAYALEALKGVGPAAQRALPEILQALKDRDPALRTVAAGILGTIADDEAITALAEARKDPEVTVRRSVVRSLDALRPAPGTIPALIAALDDPDEETARLAGAALKKARITKEDIAALGNMLSQGEANGRASAAAFLAALGPDARAAKASLIKALKDQDKRVRKHAATALGSLKADAWEVSTKLAALLTDEDRGVRKSAIAALGQLGPDAGAATPQLFHALHDDQLHEEISRALVKIGKKAVPTLVEKLSVKQDSVKIEACRLLGEIGPDAADAIEPLSALAQDKKNQLPRVWKAAGEALKKIER